VQEEVDREVNLPGKGILRLHKSEERHLVVLFGNPCFFVTGFLSVKKESVRGG
jgi:hypothetical protein